MVTIPTDEQIREELHSAINSDPKLKCCANCCHYSLVAQYCSKIQKSFPRYFYGCRHYITNEEMLIAKARENLIEQARECEKVEFLLAMSFTLAGTTSLVIEDLERRVKSVYQREKESKAAKALRSDLQMAAQMDRAFKVIDDHLVKIETQYRLYIQSQLDKIFKKEGIPYSEDVKIGIMIETPAAAILSDRLAKEVDFFSVGTNDLTQYTLAVDRQNAHLGEFYDPYHPAVLALMAHIAKCAKAAGIWAGICGELGADPKLTETFIQMGYTELSMAPGRILETRKLVCESEV